MSKSQQSKVKNQGYINKSITNSWATPKYLIDKLNKIYHFDNYDPCPYNPNWKEGDLDGRDEEWKKRTFVNPPYSQLKSTKKKIGWVEKAHIEAQKGKLIVMLIPSRTDTSWFHDIILENNYRVKFLRGRVKFYNDEKKKSVSAPFPSMIVIFQKYKTKLNIGLQI